MFYNEIYTNVNPKKQKAMKRLLLTFIALVGLIFGANAQDKFVLSPDGFISSADSTKNYIVVDAKGEQAKLYQSVKGAVLSLFRSPKDVLSEAAPDMLTINGFVKEGIKVPRPLGLKMTYDVNFTLVFRFKDGKIRIDAPSFVCQNTSMGNQTVELLIRGSRNYGLGSTVVNTIYNKKGDKYEAKPKKAMEDFCAELINKILSATTNQDSDW